VEIQQTLGRGLARLGNGAGARRKRGSGGGTIGRRMEIKYKIWIEKDGKIVFGRGRETILKAIREASSLNNAARKLQMSYRAAWGRLKASEQRMGMKLVAVETLEKGMHLTPQAEAIIARFEKLGQDVEALLGEANRDFRLLMKDTEHR
jgi:molybdate transport system regulatory protein